MVDVVEDGRSLSSVLGRSRELALFEAFALRGEQSLSVKDASQLANVAWATAHRLVTEWALRGVLDQVGKVGKARLYHLNMDSPTVRLLSYAANYAVRELLESDLLAEDVPEASFVKTIVGNQTAVAFPHTRTSTLNEPSRFVFSSTRSIEGTSRNTAKPEGVA
jgi:hypothetical protein